MQPVKMVPGSLAAPKTTPVPAPKGKGKAAEAPAKGKGTLAHTPTKCF